MGCRLVVGPGSLEPVAGVRILPPQHKKAMSFWALLFLFFESQDEKFIPEDIFCEGESSHPSCIIFPQLKNYCYSFLHRLFY